MKNWLSSTWEANWTSFQYFNIYRLVLAGMFVLATAFPHDWMRHLNLLPSARFFLLTGGYVIGVCGGLLATRYWQQRFNLQLSIQVAIDVAVVSLLMYVAGGIGSGLGFLLLVSLAAASLVGRGRLVLFYAAMATLAVLTVQLYGVLTGEFDSATLVQAGFISAAFFATAILARLLGQRAMFNEDLARRRGEALANQIRISQRVVERMLDGILIVSKEGSIEQSNPVAREMLGFMDAKALHLGDVSSQLDLAFFEWRRNASSDTLEFPGSNGFELRARFEPTTSTDGEALLFLEDVGRVKEEAQRLKLASLGRLTASIAHEIRNPLSAISHAGELLREERRGEMQDRLLRILNDNVHRLDRIVQDILSLGRQHRAETETIDLALFCSAFVDHFERSEGLPDASITLSADETAVISFDRSHLHQVLWNLLSNAWRHSSKVSGAVALSVSIHNHGTRVELEISDDGPGIPDAVREQIFEPFFTTHHEGTGLGLFIARELCVTNAASLDLIPSEVRGAHFVIAGRNETCLLSNPKDVPAAH